MKIEDIVRNVNYGDLEEIAKIHKESYPEGHFLNELSIKLIKNYYKSFLKPNVVFLVYVKENKIYGFVLGGSSQILAQGRNNFIMNNKYQLVLYGMSRCYSLKFMEKFFSRTITFYKSQIFKNHKIPLKSNLPCYSLLSIAVSNEVKGKEVSNALLSAFEEQLLKAGVNRYTLSVKKNNIRAVKFYYKTGFHIERETSDGIYMYKLLRQNN